MLQSNKLILADSLKKETEQVFGRRILTNGDCLQLSNEILSKTDQRLSPHTIRRFFGLVQSEYSVSVATLTILSKYCGFRSLNDVDDYYNDEKEKNNFDNESIIRYLVALFENINTISIDDRTFQSLVKQTVVYITQQPQLASEFQRQVAKTKNGRDFYFEQFVHIDALDSFYGDGLRYYLNEDINSEREIFAHSLLIMRYWLTDEMDKLKDHFLHIDIKQTDEFLSPYLAARYYAGKLFYADALGILSEPVLANARKLHIQFQLDNNYYNQFPFFEFAFSEALVLTGHYNEGLYYIEHSFQHHLEAIKRADTGFLQNFTLLKAIALCKLGDKEEALIAFRQIKTSEFHFMAKKFTTILYLLLSDKLKGNFPEHKDQRKTLIGETGFVRMETIL